MCSQTCNTPLSSHVRLLYQAPISTVFADWHKSEIHAPQIEWTGEVVQLAWKPRIFLYKKFLSDAECDHLINKGKKDIKASEVPCCAPTLDPGQHR